MAWVRKISQPRAERDQPRLANGPNGFRFRDLLHSRFREREATLLQPIASISGHHSIIPTPHQASVRPWMRRAALRRPSAAGVVVVLLLRASWWWWMLVASATLTRAFAFVTQVRTGMPSLPA